MTRLRITCTTCKAALSAPDASVVGELFTCPKCGSMVMVQAPDAAAPSVADAAPVDVDSDDPSTVTEFHLFEEDRLGEGDSEESSLGSTLDDFDPDAAASESPPIPQVRPSKPPPTPGGRADEKGAAGSGPWKVPSKLPEPAPAKREIAPAAAPPSPPPPDAAPKQPLLPGDQWASPQFKKMKRMLRLGAAMLAGAVLAICLLGLIASRHASSTKPNGAVAASDPAEDRQPDAKEEANPPATAPAEEIDEPAAATEAPKVDETPQKPAPDVETSTVEEGEPGNREMDSPPADALSPFDESTTNEDKNSTGESPPGESTKENPSDADPSVQPEEDAENTPGDFEFFAPYIDPQPPIPAMAPLIGSNEKPEPQAATAPPPAEAPAIPRPEPRAVDVPARLADVMVEIKFPGTPLVKAARMLSQFSTIPITLEAEALQRLGVSSRTPVSVHLKDAPLADVISAMVDSLGLGWRVENGHVLIGFPASDGSLRRVTYQVDDLVDTASPIADLRDLIVAVVQPDSWKSSGGQAEIAVEGESLIVEQTERAHSQIFLLCEKLRVAKNLPPRSGAGKAEFEPLGHLEEARAKLARVVSGNFQTPTALTRILDYLSDQAELDVLIDWQAVAEAGWPPDSEASLVVDQEAMSDALNKLLSPMDLTWRTIDERTIQVTTSAAMARRPMVEVFPVNGKDTNGPELTSKATKLLDNDHSAVLFHEHSKSLVVSAPQNDLVRIFDSLSP